MKNLEKEIEIIITFKFETVQVLGKNYFVHHLCFEGKEDPTIILELWKTSKQVQFRLEWFV